MSSIACRRRRIKCDEGRPICNNCIKSRRECEGYSQRVIFKEPLGSFSSPFSQGIYSSGPSGITGDPLSTHPGRQPSRGLFPAIAPRPPSFDHHQHGMPLQPVVAPYQHPFHQGALLQNAPAYNMGLNQYMQAPYNTQFPNPLLVAEANGGHGYFATAPPEALFYPAPDRTTTQDAITSFGGLNGDNGLSSHPGAAVSQPLNNQWEPDLLDDEVSIPDSDDDMPDLRRNLPPIKNMVSERWTLNAAGASIFSAFAQNDDVLAYMETPYSAEYWASGLNMVFMHFINVTGPGISIFEGNISCASERGKSRTAAGPGQSLWSCKSIIISEKVRVHVVCC